MTKNLKIDDELHKELKKWAAEEGKELRVITEFIIASALESRRKVRGL